jgi:hypothetical protein
VIVATKGQFVDLGGFKFDTWISVAPDGPGA